MKSLSAALILLLATTLPSHAEGPAPTSVTAISPVFSQLVRFSMPTGFVPAFENTNGPSYIREAVQKGETVQQWTQMITLTGAKGAADSPNFSAQNFAGALAGGFKQACPETFSAKGFGTIKLGEQDAFVAVAGCGNVGGADGNSGAKGHSETALIVAVKGKADGYTIQWAERGPPQPAAATIDDAKWQQRLQALMPIRFCEIVPGEAPPYSSCIQQK